MITLEEVIEVPRSVEECFHYVADFRTTVEWDATAVEAIKETSPVIKSIEKLSMLVSSMPTETNLD